MPGSGRTEPLPRVTALTRVSDSVTLNATLRRERSGSNTTKSSPRRSSSSPNALFECRSQCFGVSGAQHRRYSKGCDRWCICAKANAGVPAEILEYFAERLVFRLKPPGEPAERRAEFCWPDEGTLHSLANLRMSSRADEHAVADDHAVDFHVSFLRRYGQGALLEVNIEARAYGTSGPQGRAPRERPRCIRGHLKKASPL